MQNSNHSKILIIPKFWESLLKGNAYNCAKRNRQSAATKANVWNTTFSWDFVVTWTFVNVP